MSLVVETGAGLADADAYESRAGSDAYHDARGNATWAAATEAARDIAIRRATQWLDACYRWRGVVRTQSQALGWPRVGPRLGAGAKLVHGQTLDYVTERRTVSALLDADGRELVGVPAAVRRACAEAALLALSGPLLTAAQVSATRTTGPQRRVRADVVEVEFFEPPRSAVALEAQGSGALANGRAAHIDRILSGLYIPAAGGRVRIGKA